MGEGAVSAEGETVPAAASLSRPLKGVKLDTAVVTELDDRSFAELLDQRLVRERGAFARRVANAIVVTRALAGVAALGQIVVCERDALHHVLHANTLRPQNPKTPNKRKLFFQFHPYLIYKNLKMIE